MPKTRLTDISVKSLKAPVTGQTTYWDAAMPTFGVRVSQGGARSFVVVHGADRKRRTIGRYPVLSLSDARAEAKRILASVTLGTTPAKTVTFEEALSLFLETCQRKVRPRTAKDYDRLLRKHFLEKLRRKELGDITTHDITKLVDGLIDTPSECWHASVVIKTFFRWAARRSLLRHNPCEHLQSPTQTVPREKTLTTEELGKVLSKAIAVGFPFGAIVALLTLTGQRRGEIAALRWEWIDKESQTITLPSSISKNKRSHTFPFGDMVAQILNMIPEQGELLFPARGRVGIPFSGWSKAKKSFDKQCQVATWTLHDLRRTFATGLAALGTPIHVTEKLLNHVSGTTGGLVAVYQRHAYADEMRTAMLAWEKRLSEIIA